MYYCRKLTNDEIASVYDLYMKKDFPANELKPFSIIEKSLEKGQYFCCGIFNGDKFCGYACFVTLLTESKEYISHRRLLRMSQATCKSGV